MGCACLVATMARLPLAWDGSGYALAILSSGKAVMIFGRVSNALIQLPIVISMAAGSRELALTVFSFVYAFIPFAILVVLYRLLRSRGLERLFIWPALHICTISIWGQAFFVSESLIAQQLCWIVLFLLLDTSRHIAQALAGFLVIYFLHPVSSLLLIFIALMCIREYPRIAESKRRFFGSFVVALSLAASRFFWVSAPYERESIAPSVFFTHFASSFSGGAGYAVILGMLIVILIAFLRRNAHQHYSIRTGIGLCLLTILCISFYWAHNPELWFPSFRINRFTPFLVLPLYGLFYREYRFSGAKFVPPHKTYHWIYLLLASVFATILIAQSLSWSQLSKNLTAHLASTSECCTPVSRLDWAKGTAIHFWGGSYLSLLIQDTNRPSKFLDTNDCHLDFNQNPLRFGDGPKLLRSMNLVDLSAVGRCDM